MTVLIGMHCAAMVQAHASLSAADNCTYRRAGTPCNAQAIRKRSAAASCRNCCGAGPADRLGSRAWQGRGHQVHDSGGRDVADAEVCADQEDLAARLRFPLLCARHDAPSRWASTLYCEAPGALLRYSTGARCAETQRRTTTARAPMTSSGRCGHDAHLDMACKSDYQCGERRLFKCTETGLL